MGAEIGLAQVHRSFTKAKTAFLRHEKYLSSNPSDFENQEVSEKARELVYTLPPSGMGPFHTPGMLQHPKL